MDAQEFRAVITHFAILASVATLSALQAADNVTFNRDVRSILSEHCFECHGPDAENRQADLRLDIEADAKADAVVAGDAKNSPVWQRISTNDPDVVMPPPEAKKPLTKQQITILKQWIDQGAVYEKHWSFMPVVRPNIPAIDGKAQHGIDFFIRRRLKKEGLSSSAKADRATLLRRVTLDLTGLPPTPGEIRAFAEDTKPGAYERVVDRLLASKHYGEHMALPWLEAARYADTSGYQADWERFMWPWRNWVIDAFNDNMPFDQFTIEQLAGDMLPNANQSQILATGFNRNHRINDEGGVIAAEYAVEYVVDRIDTTSTVWLGLTMGCSRCHDHKYDPLPQQDFYNMFALFNNVPEKGKDGRPGYALPVLDFPDPAMAGVLQDLGAQKSEIDQRLMASVEAADDLQQEWEDGLREELSKDTATQWRLARPASAKATGGVLLKQLEDGSYLRDGENPATTTYSLLIPAKELQSAADGGLMAFRLEALTHPSLTGGSLSRSSNGNFVLSEFRVEVLRGREKLPVKLSTAMADHSQDRHPAEQAIDGKKNTGWAAEGHVKKEDRTLVVTLAEPYQYHRGDRLRVQLEHASQYSQHVIGRFRLSTTSAVAPTLDGRSLVPPQISAALAAETPSEKDTNALTGYFRDTHPAFRQLREERSAVQQRIADAKKKQFVKVMVMSEMETPRDTFVLTRGLYDQPDKERPADPDAPAVFGGLNGFDKNRLGFARWLVSKDHPLTARVTVNRFWQQFFGRGLVETVEDFGSQGTPPSHPELLDWLASEFRDSGWNVKRLVKLIVTSDAYQQSSVVEQSHVKKDPRNLLLARAPRVRLSGYQLRDQALAASDLLVRQFGGPSVLPYQPPGLWSEVSFQSKSRRTDFYTQDHGDKLYRRGLYTFWKRSVAPPMLANFDAAGREMCTVRQIRTSTPLQALNLMNDVTFVEAARGMAQRMLMDGGPAHIDQIRYGFALVGVEPTEEKLAALQNSLTAYQKYFADTPEAATEFLSNGEWEHSQDLAETELAAMSVVASVILNLDEVVVRQ